jgi:hypothetical protein
LALAFKAASQRGPGIVVITRRFVWAIAPFQAMPLDARPRATPAAVPRLINVLRDTPFDSLVRDDEPRLISVFLTMVTPLDRFQGSCL